MAAFGNAMRLNQFYLASIPNIVEGQGPGGTVLVCLVCLACLCYVGVLGVPCVPGFPGVIGVLGVLGVWSVSALWLLNVRILVRGVTHTRNYFNYSSICIHICLP